MAAPLAVLGCASRSSQPKANESASSGMSSALRFKHKRRAKVWRSSRDSAVMGGNKELAGRGCRSDYRVTQM